MYYLISIHESRYFLKSHNTLRASQENLGVYALVLVAESRKDHGKRPSVNEVMVRVATVTGSGSLRSLCSMLSI